MGCAWRLDAKKNFNEVLKKVLKKDEIRYEEGRKYGTCCPKKVEKQFIR